MLLAHGHANDDYLDRAGNLTSSGVAAEGFSMNYGVILIGLILGAFGLLDLSGLAEAFQNFLSGIGV